MKQKQLQFIKHFSNISISKLCKQLHINRANVLNGRASEETTRLLYDEIIKQIDELLKNKNREML